MHLGVGRIDDEIKIRTPEKLSVIGQDRAAGLLLKRTLAALGIKLDNGDDLDDRIAFAFKKLPVNISAASTLTDHGNSEFIHNRAPF